MILGGITTGSGRYRQPSTSTLSTIPKPSRQWCDLPTWWSTWGKLYLLI